MFSWSETNSILLQICKELRYIERSLLDCPPIKIVTLELLAKISKNLDNKNLKYIFKSIKYILIANLSSSDSKILCSSIKLINNAVRSDYFDLLREEENAVFTCIYHEDMIADEINPYIIDIFLQNKLGYELLFNVISLYNRCLVKQPTIVICNLMNHLISRSSWNDWMSTIMICPETLKKTSIIFFLEFSSYIINYKLKGIKEKNIQKMNDFNNTFTTEVAICWLNLAKELRANILPYFIKVLSLFNVEQIPEQVYQEISSFISKLLFESDDQTVLKACIEIYKSGKYNFNLENLFPLVYKKLIRLLNDPDGSIDLLKLSIRKLIFLLKNFHLYIDDLWQLLLNSLESCLLEKKQYIILVLFNIIMNMKMEFSELENNPELLALFRERLQYRNQILVGHIFNTSPADVPGMILRVFGELVNHFGSHLKLNPLTKNLYFGEKIEEYIPTYITKSVHLMDENCNDLHKEDCCSAIQLCVELIMNCKIDISYLEIFFVPFGEKNKKHSLLLINTIEKSIRNNPDIIPTFVKGFINGIIISVEQESSIADELIEKTTNIIFDKITFFIKHFNMLNIQHILTYMSEHFEYLQSHLKIGHFHEIIKILKQ